MEIVMKQNSISKSGILLECYGQRLDLAKMWWVCLGFFNGTHAEIVTQNV